MTKGFKRHPQHIDRVHRAQKLLLESIYFLYLEMDESFKSPRNYRQALQSKFQHCEPLARFRMQMLTDGHGSSVSDQEELAYGFSENVLFASQALGHGFRIRAIEQFTPDLIAPATSLCAAVDALRVVFRSRAAQTTRRPYTMLWPVLRDFDHAWTNI